MSDIKDSKPGIIAVIPQPVGNVPIRVVGESEKEAMYQAFKRGTTINDIADQYKLSYRTVMRYKNDGKWIERKAQDLAVLEKGESLLNVESYTNIMRIIASVSERMVRQIVVGAPEDTILAARADLKSLVDCVDKLKRLHIFSEAGGVDKKEIKKTTVTVDYAKMAEIYVKNKKDGQDFDDKAHLKDVIDATYQESKAKK